jgi:hypothetical protein
MGGEGRSKWKSCLDGHPNSRVGLFRLHAGHHGLGMRAKKRWAYKIASQP